MSTPQQNQPTVHTKSRPCWQGTLLLSALLLSCATENNSQGKASDEPSLAPTPIALPVGTRHLLDVDLRPYWQEGAAKEASEFFRRQAYQPARDAFAKAAKETSQPNPRIALLIALCDAKLGNHARAAKAFEASLLALPALSDFLLYQAARSSFFAHDTEAAMKHASAVSPDSIVGADAHLLRGDLLRGSAERKTVYRHYKHYLESREAPIREQEARFYMAQAAPNPGEAASLYKAITVHAPLSRWAKRASEKLVEAKTPPAAWSAEEFLIRGNVYYAAMRNEKSEADFSSALAAPGLTAAMQCEASYYRANSVYKQRNRTKAAPLFLDALAACKAVDNADLTVKAAYQAGRSFATLGQREKAISYYAQIEASHPEHSYADDARLLQSEEYRELGNHAKEGALLASLPKLYPDGDMAPEALWRLAWRAYKAKDYRKAIHWLDLQVKRTGIDDRFWAEGQALYWQARAYGKLGDKAQSLSHYRKVIADYPLSYYALLALNRLRESSPDAFEKIVSEIHQAPAAGQGDGHFQFLPREEYKSPAFARVIEFLKLGLPQPATAELSRLGFSPPKGRERITDADAIDKTWAMAYLQHSIGNYGRALWSTRWHILDYRRHWPTAGWKARWDIAYPPGYWQLINKHAKAAGIPTELAISFVREESSFDPTVESFANAIGLSQLIMPTAKRFAKGTGITVNRKSLRDPDKNLQIGTRFMAFLMNKWGQQISLIPPSYNAGEGAVAKWMRLRGDWDRDEWSEKIPYDETRRYSKRVLASFFSYRYLLHDEIPFFPNQF